MKTAKNRYDTKHAGNSLLVFLVILTVGLCALYSSATIGMVLIIVGVVGKYISIQYGDWMIQQNRIMDLEEENEDLKNNIHDDF